MKPTSALVGHNSEIIIPRIAQDPPEVCSLQFAVLVAVAIVRVLDADRLTMKLSWAL